MAKRRRTPRKRPDKPQRPVFGKGLGKVQYGPIPPWCEPKEPPRLTWRGELETTNQPIPYGAPLRENER